MAGKILKHFILFSIGGLIYISIELLFRGYTHWSMFILGGLCFVIIGEINENLSWNMPFLLQMLIGCGVITLLEFISGSVLNLWLGLKIWDYSDLPFNLHGQICLLFSIIWYFISSICIVLDDYLRYWWFSEEKPRYKVF